MSAFSTSRRLLVHGHSTHQAKHPDLIDLLPDELLLEIFAIGTLDTDGTYFPFLIAAVCSYWLTLAINEACLWTPLTVMTSVDVPVLPSDGSYDPLAIFPREALILKRSADRALTLRWVIATEREWADSHLLLNHVILLHVKDLDIGYMHTQEACQVFETFNFPALHELKLQGLDEEMESSGVFLNMMKYLPVDQLDDLSLISIHFPPGDFLDKDLVMSGSIAEKSLLLILQFIRRLALLHNLLISHCGDAF